MSDRTREPTPLREKRVLAALLTIACAWGVGSWLQGRYGRFPLDWLPFALAIVTGIIKTGTG